MSPALLEQPGLVANTYGRGASMSDSTSSRRARIGEATAFIKAAAETDDSSECIEWPFSRSTSGYGMIRHQGKQTSAHRVALLLRTGEPGPGMHAAHTPGICHNRLCVNPHHLRWATPSENHADRRLDGTNPWGELNPNAKISAADSQAIRTDPRPQAIIAKEYGISRPSVSDIKRGATWGHTNLDALI